MKKKSNYFLKLLLLLIIFVGLIFNQETISANYIEGKVMNLDSQPQDYLDYSFLGYVIQILIGSFAAMLFVFRRYLYKLADFIKNLFSNKKNLND